MKILFRLLSFCIVAIAIACLVFFSWQEFRPSPVVPPSLECTEEVNLGPKEFGSTALCPFSISNRGECELLLFQFGTSCCCAGVEMEQDGAARRVEELRISPGESIGLFVRISVAAQPGTPQVVHVRFKANDPSHAEHAIKVLIPRVTGGLSAEPSAVIFGEVPSGKSVSKIVRLYSNGTSTRKVHGVRSLQPDRFSVRLLPHEVSEVSLSDLSQLVASIEVVARTEQPLNLDGSIEVLLNEEGRISDKISVFGEVVAPVIVLPSSLNLPRYLGGRPEFAGQFALKCRDGTDFKPALEFVPDGLSASLRSDEVNPGQWLLDVATKPEGTETRTLSVRIRANLQAGGAYTFDVPVTVRAGKP